jgi:hypothetical protein
MSKSNKTYVARVLTDMGWAHSKPYKRESAAKKWAQASIEAGRVVVIATYHSAEDFWNGESTLEKLSK